MHLVHVLLPFGRRREMYERVFSELTERFGGMTAYSRSPAEGLWKTRRDAAERDDIVVVEVMVEKLDRRWWARYRVTLQRRFRQRELIVRAHAIESL